jgi:uncharacterized protein (TIGR02145 family)
VWFSVDIENIYYLQVALTDRLTGEPLSGGLKIFAEDSNDYTITYPIEANLSNTIAIRKELPIYYFETHCESYNSRFIGITADSLESITTSEKPILIIELTKNSIVLDVEGNVYKTVKIGNQTWMAENLRTTHLNNNIKIHHSGPDDYVFGNWCPNDITNLNSPAYHKSTVYWMVDKESLYYNYYAVETGKVCPSDWHVPTESDWDELISYLGGTDVAGDKMKDTIPANWYYENIENASNESGFSAIVTGYLSCIFKSEGEAIWWAKQAQNGSGTYNHIAISSSKIKKGTHHKNAGLKIRCIQNE